MTYDGISPAMSVTRSHPSRSATPSMMRRAISSIRGRIAFAARGMNSGATSLRKPVCTGGSAEIIISWSPTSIPPSFSGIMMPGLDENAAASRPTAFTRR